MTVWNFATGLWLFIPVQRYLKTVSVYYIFTGICCIIPPCCGSHPVDFYTAAFIETLIFCRCHACGILELARQMGCARVSCPERYFSEREVSEISSSFTRSIFLGYVIFFLLCGLLLQRKQPTDDIIAHVQMFLHTCRRVFAAFRLVSHVVDDGEFGLPRQLQCRGPVSSRIPARSETSVYFAYLSGGQFLGVDHPLCPALRPFV